MNWMKYSQTSTARSMVAFRGLQTIHINAAVTIFRWRLTGAGLWGSCERRKEPSLWGSRVLLCRMMFQTPTTETEQMSRMDPRRDKVTERVAQWLISTQTNQTRPLRDGDAEGAHSRKNNKQQCELPWCRVWVNRWDKSTSRGDHESVRSICKNWHAVMCLLIYSLFNTCTDLKILSSFVQECSVGPHLQHKGNCGHVSRGKTGNDSHLFFFVHLWNQADSQTIEVHSSITSIRVFSQLFGSVFLTSRL